MLDQSTRTAVLEMHARGLGSRKIARILGVSRIAVRRVFESGTAEVPRTIRVEQWAPYRDQILDQYGLCKGNLVRVHEELCAAGAHFSYQSLTAFCRRQGIGQEPKKPTGRYHFEPGQEMQHDTSPHVAPIGGVDRRVQTASLVLCNSRMIFIQLYPCFTRFECKLFLSDAFQYFGGTCGVCMIDNTHVVVLHGTGARMVPVPEMAAFAERYSFEFAAHEVGDANRSARVEGPFDFVDNNFLAGRVFDSFEHANREAVVWCDKVNAAYSSKLHGCRRELFAAEKPHMKPLPVWVPPVYRLHQRVVDSEGYVHVRRAAYSVPYQLIGRQVEAREMKQGVEVYLGPRLVASHARVLDGADTRVTSQEHRPPRGQGMKRDSVPAEERELLAAEPSLASYVTSLKKHLHGRGMLGLRRLLRLVREYPREAFLRAVRVAESYGMHDLDRLERMVLREIGQDYFVLRADQKKTDKEGSDE